MKLHMHHHTMVMYFQQKFDEIPSIVYLVMAENRLHQTNMTNHLINMRTANIVLTG